MKELEVIIRPQIRHGKPVVGPARSRIQGQRYVFDSYPSQRGHQAEGVSLLSLEEHALTVGERENGKHD